MEFIIVFLLSFIVIVNGTCIRLSASTKEDILTTVCHDVVDYDFYLPSSTNLSALNENARLKLSNNYYSILPTECTKALKRLVCSNIYLKCSTGNTRIFSDIGYPLPVPFARPCRSVCDDVNSKCLGLLNLFGLQQNCTAKYDYTFGTKVLPKYPYQYDQSNNNKYCTNVSSSFQIASTREPYIYSNSNGACAGIITELYIPPPSSINSSFSPILPPYAIQTLIENQLSSYIENLPKWLGNECHFALRKYFCGSYMLKPQVKAFSSIISSFGSSSGLIRKKLSALGLNLTALNSFNFYLPSYPSQQVCEDYSSKCGKFIELIGLEALVPNCSSMSSSISKYPNSTQTIITFPLQGSKVPLTTDPNELDSVNDNDYEPSCPTGFVIPDDPDDSAVNYVPDSSSACAIACKAPVFTVSEYSRMIRFSNNGPRIGLPLVVFLLIVWMLDETRRKQYLIIIFNVITLILAIQCVYMSTIPFEKKFCKSNAVMMSSSDGFTACNVQSFTMLYFTLAEALTWGLIAVDLYLKILTKVDTNKLWIYYISIIFLLPIIPVIIQASKNQYGYYGLTFCLTGDLGLPIFVIPIFVITTIGTVLMICVIIKIIQTAKNTKVAPIRKKSYVVPIDQNTVNKSVLKSRSNDSTMKIATGSDKISKSFDNDDSKSTAVIELATLTTTTTIANTPIASNVEKNKGSDAVVALSNTLNLEEMGLANPSKGKTYEDMKALTSPPTRKSLMKLNIPWKMIRSSFIFVTVYSFVWFTIFFLKFQTYFQQRQNKNSFIDWTECVFKYYDGSDDLWISECGEHPHHRANEKLSVWVGFVVNSHAIVVSGIFLSNPAIWNSVYNSLNKLLARNKVVEALSYRKSDRRNSGSTSRKV